MNIKILMPLVATIALAGCVSEDNVNESDSSSGSSYTPVQASINKPVEFLENDPVVSSDGELLRLRFSMNQSDANTRYLISSGNSSSPIIDVEFSYSFGDFEDLPQYLIYSIDDQINDLNDTFLESRRGEITIGFNDLPADLYQSDRYMNEGRLILDALKFNLRVVSGRDSSNPAERTVRNFIIPVSVENENTPVMVSEDFVSSFEFDQASEYYITIPLIDPDSNDILTYSVLYEDLEGMSVSTNQVCETDLTNCLIPSGSDRNIVLHVVTSSVTDVFVENVLTLVIGDQSRLAPSYEERILFEQELTVFVNNSEDDLTPRINFSESSYTISERNGGTVPFTLVPALDRPDAELAVIFETNQGDINAVVDLDVENSLFNIHSIDISEDKTFILTTTVTDGEFSSTRDVEINLVNDFDRTPVLNIPSSVLINESTGGEVSYSASSPIDRNINISVELDTDGAQFDFNHNTSNSVFEFSNIRIAEDKRVVMNITASDGVNSVSSVVEVNLVADVNITLSANACMVDSEAANNIVCENTKFISEGLTPEINDIPFSVVISNNVQERDILMSHEISLPTGVLLSRINPTDATPSGLFSFDVENFSTREDLDRVLTIVASDGVSEVSLSIPVTFVNDIDKELQVFENQYNPQRDRFVSLVSADAERNLIEFYMELSTLFNAQSFVSNRASRALSSLDREFDVLQDLVDYLDDFVANVKEDDPQSIYSDAYEKLDELSNLLLIHGMEAVFEINMMGQSIVNRSSGELTLPLLQEVENSMSLNGVFGRYIGNTQYGRYIAGTTLWRFNENRAFLELVNPRNQCN